MEDEVEKLEPKPGRTRRRRRAPMPEALKEAADRAGRRHAGRYPAPEIEIIKSGEGWNIASPYLDDDHWWKLLGEAFGTRNKAVIAVFMNQLAQLVGTDWDDEGRFWKPLQAELQAALSIVAAVKPKNEAEAALAASMVATHFAAMKMAAELAKRSYPDTRTASVLASLGRTQAQQMEAFQKLHRGGSRRQTIIVRKEVRVYNDNRKVVVSPGEGGDKCSSQPDAARRDTRARDGNSGTPCTGANAGEFNQVPALPSQDAGGEVVQFARGAGPQGVPDARGKLAGRSKG